MANKPTAEEKARLADASASELYEWYDSLSAGNPKLTEADLQELSTDDSQPS